MLEWFSRTWHWLIIRVRRYPWAPIVVAMTVWAGWTTTKTQRGLVALSGALVFVTIYYAIQTRVMVSEMREARRAQVRPKLVPTLIHPERSHHDLRLGVTNVGLGAALEVDLRLMFEPPIRSDPMKEDRRANWERPLPIHWRWPVVQAGATWVFNQPVGPPAEYTRLRDAVEKFTHLRLVARSKSPTGERLSFDERIELRGVLHDEFAATLLGDEKDDR